MAKFIDGVGIVDYQDDLRHERPDFVTNFWEFITGKPKFNDTIPKPERVNLLK